MWRYCYGDEELHHTCMNALVWEYLMKRSIKFQFIIVFTAATSDFKADMRIGDSNMKQVSDQYRKIRNTIRFMLGYTNKNDFDYAKDLVAYEDLEPLDKYMMVRN